mmetsp:Transcript_59896/g.122931  ORF Transcript_59896/g.122931 Transcript_59896/m.122931 type:complete len:298 (+) Transcript_59896:704-1597(+)
MLAALPTPQPMPSFSELSHRLPETVQLWMACITPSPAWHRRAASLSLPAGPSPCPSSAAAPPAPPKASLRQQPRIPSLNPSVPLGARSRLASPQAPAAAPGAESGVQPNLPTCGSSLARHFPLRQTPLAAPPPPHTCSMHHPCSRSLHHLASEFSLPLPPPTASQSRSPPEPQSLHVAFLPRRSPSWRWHAPPPPFQHHAPLPRSPFLLRPSLWNLKERKQQRTVRQSPATLPQPPSPQLPPSLAPRLGSSPPFPPSLSAPPAPLSPSSPHPAFRSRQPHAPAPPLPLLPPVRCVRR